MRRFDPEQIKWFWGMVIILIILGGLYLVLSFPSSVVKYSKNTIPDQKLFPYATTESSAALGHNSIATKEIEEFIVGLKSSSTYHDPFLTVGEEEWKTFLVNRKNRPPQLEGIIEIENQHIALIKSSRFREGEEVNGFLIVKINDNNVILSKEGKTYILTTNK